MTPNKEDYLKCIYEIGIDLHKITNKEIAARMQVSPPAVTEMIKRMQSENLILKNKENGYQLIKKSGFVNSPKYSENLQKRKQVYMISSGAVLNFKPAGRLADLKLHGNHSIYRMGKPIAIGVTYGKDS